MNTLQVRIQTKTDKTKVDYLNRAAGLLERIAKEMQLPEDAYPPPQDVIEFMRKNARNWKWSSFRQMQASLVYRYQVEHEKTGDQIFLTTAEEIKSLPYTDCIPENAIGQTSSRKRKGIPQKDYDLLIANLSQPRRGGKYPKRTALWLMAATAAGLRPCEWEYAILDETTGLLRVQNAKATNGRANGKERSVPIHADDIPVVRAHIQEIQDALAAGRIRFGEYHDACSQALNRACKFLWENDPLKRYALYSARHQFSANRKATETPERVAELLGHSSIRTARRHYAPRKSAWGKYKNSASREQMSHMETPKPNPQ